MIEQKRVPKYNMALGLSQLRSLTPRDQVKFYRTYLEGLNDSNMIAVVLKKAVNRAGSLGMLRSDIIEAALTQIEAFEEEFPPIASALVDFEEVVSNIWRPLKTSVNLLGVQGNNCQTTFHHRFIYGSNSPSVVEEITKTVVDYAVEAFIISADMGEAIIQDVINTSLE